MQNFWINFNLSLEYTKIMQVEFKIDHKYVLTAKLTLQVLHCEETMFSLFKMGYFTSPGYKMHNTKKHQNLNRHNKQMKWQFERKAASNITKSVISHNALVFCYNKSKIVVGKRCQCKTYQDLVSRHFANQEYLKQESCSFTYKNTNKTCANPRK